MFGNELTDFSVVSSSIEFTLGRADLEEADFGLRNTREKWFCRPQILPFAILLSFWFADQVGPQFRHSWFVCRLQAAKFCRWFRWRKGRCGVIEFTCNAGWLFEICNWFRCRSSILMAKQNACAGSTVSLSNSLRISGSCMLAMKISLIRVSSWFPMSQFSDSSYNLRKKWSIDSPFDCLVVRSMYLSKVTLRGRINVSSIIFQSSTVVSVSTLRCGFLLHTIRLPSVPKLRYNIDSSAISLYPWFISTHDSYLYLFLTSILPAHF